MALPDCTGYQAYPMEANRFRCRVGRGARGKSYERVRHRPRVHALVQQEDLPSAGGNETLMVGIPVMATSVIRRWNKDNIGRAISPAKDYVYFYLGLCTSCSS